MAVMRPKQLNFQNILFGIFHRLHYRSIELFLHSMNICKSIQQQMPKKKKCKNAKKEKKKTTSNNQKEMSVSVTIEPREICSGRITSLTKTYRSMRNNANTADTPKRHWL